MPLIVGVHLSFVCCGARGNRNCFQFTVFDFASESNNLFGDSNSDRGTMSGFVFAFRKDLEKRTIQYSS